MRFEYAQRCEVESTGAKNSTPIVLIISEISK